MLTRTLALLWIMCSSASAEEGLTDAPPGELVSRYWLEEPVTAGARIGFPNHLFSLSGRDAEGKLNHLDYSPPQATDLTVSLGYGPFQFSWKFALPQSGSSRRTYGKVSYDDFSADYGRERNAVSVYYQNFHGYYTDLSGRTGNYARINTDDNSSAKNKAPDSGSGFSTSNEINPADIVQRPDIRSRHYGALAWHGTPLVGGSGQAFQLSFRTLLDKPDPGFHLDLVNSVFFDRAQINAGLPFVPEKKAAAFGPTSQLRGMDLYSLGGGAGLATSYVFEGQRFFLDSLLHYGGGVQRQQAMYYLDQRWNTVYVDNFNFRFGLNYRQERQEAGMHFWVNTMGSRLGDARVNSSNMALELAYQLTI